MRLYRYFNVQNDEYGEPFPLCDECRDVQLEPRFCFLTKYSEVAADSCTRCGAQNAGK